MLRATVAGVRILLAGDAETEEQHAMVTRQRPVNSGGRVEVAHHGSAYQDQGFLDAVRPAVALVPVGAGNTYGHRARGRLPDWAEAARGCCAPTRTAMWRRSERATAWR